MNIKREVVDELHSQARKNFPRTHVVVKGVGDDLWQSDLIDMTNYPDKGYRYILTLIDVGSKLSWAVPIKRKTGPEVSKALLGILKESKFVPKLLQTDDGLEYKNQHVNKLLKEWNIKRYSTYSSLKASVVERFNRTLKGKIWRHFSMVGKYIWVDELPQLVKEYNGTIHRSIGMRPMDVRKKHESEILSKLNKARFVKKFTKFALGDWVRISKYKSAFSKGYTGNFTNEQFKIVNIHKNYDVPMFSLEDYKGQKIAGKFYEHELKKTKHPGIYLVEKVLKKRGERVYVKWLGFSNRDNTWINRKQVVV